MMAFVEISPRIGLLDQSKAGMATKKMVSQVSDRSSLMVEATKKKKTCIVTGSGMLGRDTPYQKVA
jgi:hypothetical protein